MPSAGAEARRNATIEAGRQRRVAAAEARLVRWEWKIKPLLAQLDLTMQERVRIATEMLWAQVIRNISRPVTKTVVNRQRTVTRNGKTFRQNSQYTMVTDRSKRGECPKADTTFLMKDIFRTVRKVKGAQAWEGYVGTSKDYGLMLETNASLDRPFLSRTLREMRTKIEEILRAPIK